VSARGVLIAYRLAFAAAIALASARTFLAADRIAGPLQGHAAHLATPAFLKGLAALEVVAALALPIRRLEPYAAAGLFATFATAGALDLLAGEFPIHLFIYAASLGFLLAVSRSQRAEPG
jgi:hypothetical protein